MREDTGTVGLEGLKNAGPEAGEYLKSSLAGYAAQATEAAAGVRLVFDAGTAEQTFAMGVILHRVPERTIYAVGNEGDLYEVVPREEGDYRVTVEIDLDHPDVQVGAAIMLDAAEERLRPAEGDMPVAKVKPTPPLRVINPRIDDEDITAWHGELLPPHERY